MMEKIMVIAPHPDDETLGCGGTILKLKELKKKIYWVIVTNISTKTRFSIHRIRSRQREIEEVAQFYNFNDIIKLNFQTTKLDAMSISEIINALTVEINKFKPDTIFVPNRSDIHSDHKITFDAVMSCTKVFRNSFTEKIFMYETISETEFALLSQGMYLSLIAFAI